MLIGHSLTDKEKIAEIIRKKGSKIYFVGIGGVGVFALAQLSLDMGLSVFGSDRRDSDRISALIRAGACVTISHRREQIYRIMPDLLVYSLAIDKDNAEYRAASELNIPAVSRAEYLGAVMKNYASPIGVCGSHGKSTTVAILGKIFEEASKSPTVIAGAALECGSSYLAGERENLIYEACEYGDSFLQLSPKIQVMLNLDLDHTDYFSSLERIKESFTAAANLASLCAVMNADDENLRSIAENIAVPVVTFSEGFGYSYRIEKRGCASGRYSFALYRGDEPEPLCEVSLSVAGEFNVHNAAAAIIAADICGIDKNIIAKAVSEFRGIERRLEYIGNSEKCAIYYDYAHHPREIEATKKALFGMGYNNICAIFAPHTYTRTKFFFSELASSLHGFGEVYITDIYGAREAPIVGVSSNSLAEAVRELGTEAYAVGADYDVSNIEMNKFDCLVLMGAGDLEKIKEKIKPEGV